MKVLLFVQAVQQINKFFIIVSHSVWLDLFSIFLDIFKYQFSQHQETNVNLLFFLD